MQAPAWSRLLLLPEKAAGREYLRLGNRQYLRWMLGGSMVAAAVATLAQASEGAWLLATPWIAIFVFGGVLLVLRQRSVVRLYSDELLLALLILVLAAIAISLPDPIGVFVFAGFFFPAFLVLLRWRASRLLILASALLATAGWAASRPADNLPLAMLIVALVFIVALAAIGWRITARRLVGFRQEYRRQAGVERDRARMSEELSDARAVQLSMLPRQPPALPWVDVASACLPASEVGGDYYDFLVLDEDRLAVVVGDVAGHGMASGLVLAGLRSGLYLLRDELDRGVEVLGKLDAMLRDTAPGRMFVTLQIALLDRRRGRLTVANAGHPPLLVISDGDSEAVGAGGPPLGTRLDAVYELESRGISPGDTLVLFTDGLSEVRNHRGETFDSARLDAEIRRAAEQPTALAVRDRLLARVSHFKGDVEQEDDVTLVVLRLAGSL